MSERKKEMILRFNKKTKKLVKKVSKQVAKRLKVDEATLCIVTDEQANCDSKNSKINQLCFETNVDDTFAVLDVPTTKWFDIIEVLEGFMKNKNVEWSSIVGR